MIIFLRGQKEDEAPYLLDAVRLVHELARELNRVLRVDSIVNYPYVSGDADSVEVRDFIDVACVDSICSGYTHFKQEPGTVNRLVSEDASVLAVSLSFNLPIAGPREISETTQSVRSLIHSVSEKYPRIEFAMVGSISQMDAFREASRRETYKLIGIAIVVVVGVLTAIYRQVSTPLMLLGLGVAGALAGVASLGLTGTPLNTSTTAVPVISMLLVIATSMHVVNAFHASQSPERPASESMADSLRDYWRPILLTVLTTCAGLASLNYADAPPLSQLGNAVSAGLVVGVGALFAIAPALARFLPARTPIDVSRGATRIADQLGNSAPVALVGLALISAYGITRIGIDENFVEYFSEDYEFRRGADFAETYMAGPKSAHIDINTNVNEGIETVKFMRFAEAFTHWLRSNSIVASVSGVSSAIVRLDEVLDDSASERTDAKIAQLLFTFEMSLGEGQDLRESVSVDRSSTRVVALLGRATSQDIMSLDRSIQEWFQTNAPPGYSVVVSGINVPIAYMALENINSVVGAIAITIFGMATAIGIYFASAVIALISLIAIALPMLMGFGLWGWFVGEIGLAAAVVIAIAMGIVIDDAIHVIYQFTQSRKSGASPQEARTIALKRAGAAITQTSIALSLGFTVLAFSGFHVNQVLGLCTAAIFVCAWMFDFFLLPNALRAMMRT